jgi:hypothetical protein
MASDTMAASGGLDRLRHADTQRRIPAALSDSQRVYLRNRWSPAPDTGRRGGTAVYTAVQKSRDPERDPHPPRDDDGPAVAQWRERMGTDKAKAIYRQRAATAECVNASARNRTDGTSRWIHSL